MAVKYIPQWLHKQQHPLLGATPITPAITGPQLFLNADYAVGANELSRAHMEWGSQLTRAAVFTTYRSKLIVCKRLFT